MHAEPHCAAGWGAHPGQMSVQADAPRSYLRTGLHALGLDISRVAVEGATTAYSLRPAPWRDTAAAGAVAGDQQQGPKNAEVAAEQGYLSYQEALRREAEPELSIQLPAAASREPAAALPVGDSPAAGGKPVADGTATAAAAAAATLGGGGAKTGSGLPSATVPAGDGGAGDIHHWTFMRREVEGRTVLGEV